MIRGVARPELRRRGDHSTLARECHREPGHASTRLAAIRPARSQVFERSSRAETPSLIGRLRAYFLTGVIVTAPISITIYLVWKFLTFLDTHVAGLLPARYNPENYLPLSACRVWDCCWYWRSSRWSAC